MTEVSAHSTKTGTKGPKPIDTDGTDSENSGPDESNILQRAAADLCNLEKLSHISPDPIPAWHHIDDTADWLTRARKSCANAPTEAGKAAEWLLDNDYQVYRAIRQIKEDLPDSFYAKLPALDGEPKSR